ncbi:MAG: hypothetical protein LBL76_06090 [Treponema sp.]|jgi:hypothetical protein|nr:hypothetical protein [Treponema sp.]
MALQKMFVSATKGTGKDNWEGSLLDEKAPHQSIAGSVPPKPQAGASVYKRWKPGHTD